MSKIKPTLPKGVRDFGHKELFKRNYIVNIIREIYEKYGFLPLETPTMENLSVLTGKYGEEGDQLLFKILNSGDAFKNVKEKNIDKIINEVAFSAFDVCEKGLRYDLTVPFARYVVMNQNDLCFPYKRYQIQPVWRADKPQKGRYREFYQCDADVIGSQSLLSEAEIICIISEVMHNLQLENYSIKINNRKILEALVQSVNETRHFVDITVAIDKLDKIGINGVIQELKNKNVSENAITKLTEVLSLSFNNINDAISYFESYFINSNELGVKGVEELKEVFSFSNELGNNLDKIDFDITLARGLNYYTGCIFEVKVHNVSIGSISGGGRYDNLTEGFGLANMTGVGFSFGLDRLYDVLLELDLFPENIQKSTLVLIIPFDQNDYTFGLNLLSKLRQNNIKSELYPDIVKIKKSMNYANLKNIPYVVLIGSNERISNTFTLKDMQSGEQFSLSIENLIHKLTNEHSHN